MLSKPTRVRLLASVLAQLVAAVADAARRAVVRRKDQILLTIGGLGVAGYTGLFFAWGMHIGANDARLFQRLDAAQVQIMARSCGRHGTLYQRPDTKRYACVYSHGADTGEAMLQTLPAKVLVAGWE